jgi:hypothetical protein
MTSNYVNRQKCFTDVVSIDAWHEKSSDDGATVDLHTDVVFVTARIGGEAQSKVHFRLSIKQAELVVIIPESEPFAVDRRSVARFIDIKTMTLSIEESTDAHGAIEGNTELGASPGKVSASVHAKLSANVERTVKETSKRTEERAPINITHRYLNSENSDSWTFQPVTDVALDGRPWDPLKSPPLLRLVDMRSNRKRGIAPSVRLVIRCAREDLDITDIELKDSNLLNGWIPSKNGLKAAEAYIRNKLEEVGLEIGDISDKFAKILLADVVANNGPIG